VTLELLDWTIIGPAFVAGLIVLSTHVPLGHEVLKRGIIFIDLAIAQIAGLGVIAPTAWTGIRTESKYRSRPSPLR
jgi:zinc/manganese transport system permease protein